MRGQPRLRENREEETLSPGFTNSLLALIA